MNNGHSNNIIKNWTINGKANDIPQVTLAELLGEISKPAWQRRQERIFPTHNTTLETSLGLVGMLGKTSAFSYY